MTSVIVVLALCFFVALLAVGVASLVAERSASSNRSTYARYVAVLVRRFVPPAGNVSDADLVRLPAPLRAYLVRAGIVGRPRVNSFRLKFHGAIRPDPSAAWMSFTGEQHTSLVRPERLFFMRATRNGLPLDGLHVFRADSASMRIRLASLKTVADVTGPALVQSETVTFFNDLCLFAPAALVDAPVAWEEVDAKCVRGRFTLGGHTIAATLHFDAAGDLVDFKCDERYQDVGGAHRVLPWSTPVDRYRTFGDGIRIPSYGTGWWHPPEGTFAYLRIEIDEIAYNLGPGRDQPTVVGQSG
jgi:hypothetical protein